MRSQKEFDCNNTRQDQGGRKHRKDGGRYVFAHSKDEYPEGKIQDNHRASCRVAQPLKRQKFGFNDHH